MSYIGKGKLFTAVLGAAALSGTVVPCPSDKALRVHAIDLAVGTSSPVTILAGTSVMGRYRPVANATTPIDVDFTFEVGTSLQVWGNGTEVFVNVRYEEVV